MKKRIVSLVLVAAMMFSMISAMGIPAFAASTEPAAESTAVLAVEGTWGNPGETVDVNLVLTENPGILGATFTVSWGDGLTLEADASGEAFAELTYQRPSRYVAAGTNFVWYGNEVGEVADGTILTLTFRVSETVENNDILPIRVTYTYGDIIDGNDNDVAVDITDGYVRVLTYKPGDTNGDGRVNARDLVNMSQYISDGNMTDPEGYNAVVDEGACDVTGDGRINARDLILLSQYISDGGTVADGYNAKLQPAKMPECSHPNMQEHAAIEATCTEDGNVAYWSCADCAKYFSDAQGTTEISLSDIVVGATGHTEVVDEAVDPTYDATGLTEGKHCSVCGTVLIEQQVIEALKPDYFAVVYRNDKGAAIADEYRTYASHLGLTLPTKDDISVEGYNFEGWYTEENGKGTRLYDIEVGTTGKIEVHGYWTPVKYSVVYTGVPDDFDNGISGYTIEDGNIYLSKKPEWKHLIFTGWEDQSGNLSYNEQGIPTIKAGTTGDVILKATWKNRQNIFDPAEKQYSSAAFNEEDGKYYFFYHLGNVSNVLLAEKEGNGRDHTGVETTLTTSKTVTFSKNLAKGHATAISNATKTSLSATLSSEFTTSLSTTVGASATAGAEVDGLFAKGTASATASTEVTAGATWSAEVGISSSTDNETSETNETTSTISFMEESTFTEEESKTLTAEDPRGKYYFVPGGTFEIYSVVVYDPIANELQYDVYSKHIDTYPMILYYPDATDVDVTPEIDSIPYDVYEDEIAKTITESFFVFYDAGHEAVVVDEENARVTDSFKLNSSETLPLNNFYSRYGYLFDGWELRDMQGNLLVTKIEDGAPISLLAQYVAEFQCRVFNLVARWKSRPRYSFTISTGTQTLTNNGKINITEALREKVDWNYLVNNSYRMQIAFSGLAYRSSYGFGNMFDDTLVTIELISNEGGAIGCSCIMPYSAISAETAASINGVLDRNSVPLEDVFVRIDANENNKIVVKDIKVYVYFY